MENLALACVLCNRHKGADIAAPDPLTEQIVPLFHPRRDRWNEHFAFDGPLIVPISAAGRATVSLLRLNAAERILERREILDGL